MNTDTTRRLTSYIRAVNAAEKGMPYPDRDVEGAFAEAHLPRTREEFEALVSAVRATGWFALPVDVAAILVGTSAYAFESAGGQLMLCNHKHFDLTRTWGVQSYGDESSWKVENPRPACVICGMPSYSRANLGWACMNHYDELS